MRISKKNFKEAVTRNRWLKYVPNSLTLCNSLCGFAAILYTIRAFHNSDYDNHALLISAWIILFAMVFDALDGFAARIFNAASMHGMQMDSLADMVTFGVAPAAIIAVMAHSINDATGTFDVYVYSMSCIYMGGAALRLATYNVHALMHKKSGDQFSGLPSPGAAAGVCSVLLFFNNAGLYDRFSVELAIYLPIYAALLGLLMVSHVPYLHVGKWIFSARRNGRNFVILVILLIVIAIFKTNALAALINIYIFSAPVISFIKWLVRPKSNGPQAAAN
jgi:CDP-diacylglycerol--serine O-phosphatidyltransferase